MFTILKKTVRMYTWTRLNQFLFNNISIIDEFSHKKNLDNFWQMKGGGGAKKDTVLKRGSASETQKRYWLWDSIIFAVPRAFPYKTKLRLFEKSTGRFHVVFSRTRLLFPGKCWASNLVGYRYFVAWNYYSEKKKI